MWALLGRIAGLVIGPILEWVYQKVAVAIHDYVVRREATKAIEAKNEAARKASEAAQTKEERDAAANAIRDNLGS